MTAAKSGGIPRGAILAAGAAVLTLLVIGAALLVHDLTSAKRRTPAGAAVIAEAGGEAAPSSSFPQGGAPDAPGAEAGARTADGVPHKAPGGDEPQERGTAAGRDESPGIRGRREPASQETALPSTSTELGGTPLRSARTPSLPSTAAAGGHTSTVSGASAAAAPVVTPTTSPAASAAEHRATPPAENREPAQHAGDEVAADEPEDDAHEEVETDPESDRNPPSLDGLRFDPPEINDGGMATLYVQASDDLSGPGSVTGVISSPSGAAMLPFRVDAAAETESVFAIKIAIPAKAETGVWFVSNLVVYDRVQNPLIQRFTNTTVPPGGSIRVTSAESDSAPPEILRMSIERSSMAGGEKNRVRVEVQDDRSGVASVRGTFQSPTKAALVPFLCQATGDPNVWQGEFMMPAGAECGAWTVQSVRPADVAGNSGVLQEGAPQTAGAGFTVTGSDCDEARPQLVRLTLSPDSVTNESDVEINVTAELEDPNNKCAAITGWVAGPVSTTGQPPMLLFSCTRTGPEPNAPWTGKIKVTANSPKGTWTVRMVRMRDTGMTSRDYTTNDPVLQGVTFTVR